MHPSHIDSCLPCPVCRSRTSLPLEGVEGLRPNLTAIGLLDVPMMVESNKPLLHDNIAHLRDEVAGKHKAVRRNLGEVEVALRRLHVREEEEKKRLLSEYDWIRRLLLERQTQHMGELSSGFTQRRDLLLIRQTMLRKAEEGLEENLQLADATVAELDLSSQALLERKQRIRRSLREFASSIPVGASLTQSSPPLAFQPSFFGGLCDSVMMFGHVVDNNVPSSTARHSILQLLDQQPILSYLDSSLLRSILLPSAVPILTAITRVKQGVFGGVRMVIEGLAELLGFDGDNCLTTLSSHIDRSLSLVQRTASHTTGLLLRSLRSCGDTRLLGKLQRLVEDPSAFVHMDCATGTLVFSFLGIASRVMGISAAQVAALGYSPQMLRRMGFSAQQLRAAGFIDLRLLRGLGFSPRDLVDAGYGLEELSDAGCSITDLILARAFDLP